MDRDILHAAFVRQQLYSKRLAGICSREWEKGQENGYCYSHPLREDIWEGGLNEKICFLLLFLGEWLEIGGNPGKNKEENYRTER